MATKKPEGETPFERFASMTKRLLAVDKKEISEKKEKSPPAKKSPRRSRKSS